ncbi:MAG: PilZ domain-containing protein, partial [Planctomycetota bacterium]
FFDRGSKEPTRFTVNDLSSSGLAVRLSPGHDYELSETKLVRAQFELPGDHGDFDLQVRFVHRSFVKGVERIGFLMDLASTEQGEAQSERILRYVMERQSQLLRG